MKFNIETTIVTGRLDTAPAVANLRQFVRRGCDWAGLMPAAVKVIVHRYPAAPGLVPMVNLEGEMPTAEFRDMVLKLEEFGWIK